MDLILPLIPLILTLLLLLAAILFIVWMVQNILLEAPFLPLPRPVVMVVSDLVDLSPGDEFYDLGSGDGRVVRALAKKYPQAKCFAVEKALLPHLLSIFFNLWERSPNVFQIRTDFKHQPLKRAKVVFVYLFPEVMGALSTKLMRELSPGATIISAQFTFPGLVPNKVVKVQDGVREFKLYVYHLA